MNRAICLIVLAWLPAAALGGATTPGGGYNVRIPGFDPDTGEKIWELQAVKVTPVPDRPDLMEGTNVRIAVFDEDETHVATGKRGRVNTQKNTGTLEENVVIRFGDEQATRVDTDRISWDGAKGIAVTNSPVKITRKDMTIEGLGLRVRLRDIKDAKGRTKHADQLTIERRVRVVIQSDTNWLLPEPKPGPRAKANKNGKAAPAAPSKVGKPAASPKKQRQPITITCTGPLTVYRGEMTAVFRDNVRAVQGDGSLTSDVLTVTFRTEKGKKERAVLHTVTATSKVRVDDARSIAFADEAQWSRDNQSARLIGQPAQVRWDNGSRITAGVIHRMQGGNELLCSPSAGYPHRVHLLAYSADGSFALPGKKDASPKKPGAKDR